MKTIDIPQQLAMITSILMRLEARVQMLEARPPRRDGAKPTPKKSVRHVRDTMATIIARAADEFGVSQSSIMSRDATRPTAQARQWAMTEGSAAGLSISSVGRYLGRDHTTVIHGVRAETARRKESLNQ